MWYWLDDEADHEYTKDVDFAVPQASVPSILDVLRQTDAEVSQLTIGGVNARIAKRGIRAGFIDRASDIHGQPSPGGPDMQSSSSLSSACAMEGNDVDEIQERIARFGQGF